MTAILKVDTIQDTSGNNIINENANTVTIGKAGDTVNVVGTLQNNGSAVTSYTNSDALSLFNASGSAPVYACRAWVNFNGTGTVAINGNGNVSSITDNGVGDYTVNFTTAMSDTNYSVVATKQNTATNVSSGIAEITANRATSSVRITTFENANSTDSNNVSVAVFR